MKEYLKIIDFQYRNLKLGHITKSTSKLKSR